MSYAEQMARLTARKIEQTRVKQDQLGARDEDDYGLVLPPESFKADLPVRDATGQFSGPRAWAANFRWLMEHHPLYIDPDDALAGRWMFMLSRMRLGYQLSRSNFAFDYSHLEPLQKKYDITTGIGKDAHFAPDYQIGLDLGWGGLLEKVRAARLKFSGRAEARPSPAGEPGRVAACCDRAEEVAYAIELMDAEEQAILGVQAWIRRLGEAAADRTMTEEDPVRRANLAEMARICLKLVGQPPETLREVVQWIAIFNMASRRVSGGWSTSLRQMRAISARLARRTGSSSLIVRSAAASPRRLIQACTPRIACSSASISSMAYGASSAARTPPAQNFRRAARTFSSRPPQPRSRPIW